MPRERVTSAANSPWSPASLSRHPRRRSRRILDPPTGLLPVSPQRVEDGAAPGPDLDVAVLGQLSEPPVGLGDRQRGPRCGRSGRDLTALPDRLQQFPLPLLLGDPDRPTFTKSSYTTREQPERRESDPEVSGEDPPQRTPQAKAPRAQPRSSPQGSSSPRRAPKTHARQRAATNHTSFHVPRKTRHTSRAPLSSFMSVLTYGTLRDGG